MPDTGECHAARFVFGKSPSLVVAPAHGGTTVRSLSSDDTGQYESCWLGGTGVAVSDVSDVLAGRSSRFELKVKTGRALNYEIYFIRCWFFKIRRSDCVRAT